ncbi:unnamed protein product [Urochloa decumbens]|uniref:Uncharacterized protein n=1 Tax=Urochloa decumbens TaxID=240449 RepID=A0ABC9DMR7_9POAL
MAYVHVPQADEPELIGGAGAGDLAAPIGAGDLQRRFLHAGRILVTSGCLVLTYTTIGNRAAANAEHALVGLGLLLHGVFLSVLAPVASQFPGAARVLFYFFAPGN